MIGASGAGRFVRHRTACAAAVLGAALLLSGCSGQPAADPDSTYGSLPTFLPSVSGQADSVLTGTAAAPAVTSEGDAVNVQLTEGTVLATVAGPEVPGEGLPFEGPATTCTWTVTLKAGSTRVPVSVADFSSIDHFGTVFHPTVLAGSKPPPAVLEPGQKVSFQLRSVMNTGEGLMRWAPRQHVLASWDFVVEND